jgi:DNA repair protein SbcC/Rad50
MKMKIKQLNIENFRCFKGNNSFDMDEKTIILYGENGYGKSSFFDALEWCLTGTVDRFRQPGEKGVNKNIILNRLAEAGETCSVELKIDGIILKRSFNNIEKPREVVYIKDNLTNKILAQGKESVEKYIGEHLAEKTANKKLLSTLLKKSHILSQDQITDFVLRDNPKDRFDSLADIMGYRQIINLAENLKKIDDVLKHNIKQENESISTYENVIHEKVQEKVEVDVIEVNTLLNELNIDITSQSSIEEIEKKENLLVREEVKLNEKLANFKKISSEITKISYLDTELRAADLKTSLETELSKHRKIEMLLGKVGNEIKQIEKKQSNIVSQSNLVNEKIELEKKVKELQSFLEKTGEKEDELNGLVLEVEITQQELIYAQSHLQNYRNSISIQDLTPNRLLKKKQEFVIYDKRLDNIKKYQGFFENFLEGESEGTSLASLNNAIQDVYSYIISNKSIRICPVCSSDRGENLQSEVLKNIHNNIDEISKMSNKLNKVNEKIKYAKQKIQMLKKERMSLENEINNMESELLISEKSLLDIRNNELFNKDYFEDKNIVIEELLNLSSEKLSRLNNYRVQYHTLRTQQRQLSNLSRKELINDQVKISNLKKRSLTLRNREEKLKRFLESKKQSIKIKDQEYEMLDKSLFLLSNVLESSERAIPIDTLSSKVNKDIVKIKIELEKLRNASSSVEKLRENSKVEKNILQYKDIISKKTEKVKIYKGESRIISEHRASIYKQIGSKASDLLNKPNSSIQKYFRYLNPVPSVNRVLFNSPSPEELEIILSYTNERDLSENQSNVQHSLSSGQLYVLAISIFLAINEAQNVSRLNFIGIDDPIQNMDDVNQFSICDVLSSLNKQLIFSTHDFEFLKLYLKKNEHKKESIQVFMFEHTDDSTTSVKKVGFNN